MGFYFNKSNPVSIVTFDWKDEPEWAAVRKGIEHVKNMNFDDFEFIEIETRCDEYAVAIAPAGMPHKTIKFYWDNYENLYPCEEEGK